MSKTANPSQVIKTVNKPKYLMYYSLQLFFDNGGGECYIVSVGDLSKGIPMEADLQTGLDEIKKLRDATLIVFPDAMNMSRDDYYKIHNAAIAQCVLLKDRFTVFDVWIDDTPNNLTDNIDELRSANLPVGSDTLKYAAVYYPRIYVDIAYLVDETKATLTVTNDPLGKNYSGSLAGAIAGANNFYWMARNAIDNFTMLMPVSSAAVGLYAYVDSSRGVWKAPANVAITDAIKPERAITNEEQETMNVDPQDGKSVNVVRSFPGRGPAIVWGARTLAGNDNEWRYIPVRRLFIMVETSVKNATQQFVFEPNDENTWVRVKSMIENYLTQLWKEGALMGASAKEAFYVHVGLGQTMTEVDVWEGRMIVQIGMAAVRPAEFIILQFMHKMLSES
jgi:phage tail sheath protein FI